jgi:hypothetical protein
MSGRFLPGHKPWDPFWASPRRLHKQIQRVSLCSDNPFRRRKLASGPIPTRSTPVGTAQTRITISAGALFSGPLSRV